MIQYRIPNWRSTITPYLVKPVPLYIYRFVTWFMFILNISLHNIILDLYKLIAAWISYHCPLHIHIHTHVFVFLLNETKLFPCLQNSTRPVIWDCCFEFWRFWTFLWVISQNVLFSFTRHLPPPRHLLRLHRHRHHHHHRPEDQDGEFRTSGGWNKQARKKTTQSNTHIILRIQSSNSKLLPISLQFFNSLNIILSRHNSSPGVFCMFPWMAPSQYDREIITCSVKNPHPAHEAECLPQFCVNFWYFHPVTFCKQMILYVGIRLDGTASKQKAGHTKTVHTVLLTLRHPYFFSAGSAFAWSYGEQFSRHSLRMMLLLRTWWL